MAYLVGQGPIALPGGYTSQYYSQTSGNPGPGFPVRPGTRAVDQDGYVYEFCDFVGTVLVSQAVVINDDHTATPVSTAIAKGRIGIAQCSTTSDYGGWVLIYGRALMMLGGSGASPSDAANGPTTAGTSAATRFIIDTSNSTPAGLAWVTDASTSGFVIQGLWVATDASLDVSAAVTSGGGPAGNTGLTSNHTGNSIGVFLNYPYISTGDYAS